jgi:hypothetical protein
VANAVGTAIAVAYAGTERNANCDAAAVTNAVAHADTNAHAAGTITNANADTITNANANADTITNANTNIHTDASSHAARVTAGCAAANSRRADQPHRA